MPIDTARMADALAKSGLSKTDLAKRLGVDRSTVSRWFNEDREPETVVMLQQLAMSLGLTLAGLTGQEDAAATPFELALLRQFRTLDQAQAQAALALLAYFSPRSPSMYL